MATQTRIDEATHFCFQQGIEAHRLAPQYDVPRDMVRPLLCYLVFGDSLGGFLTAVVAGDFYRAALNADADNYPKLAHFGKWIGQTWPQVAFGSYDKCEAWEGLANR